MEGRGRKVNNDVRKIELAPVGGAGGVKSEAPPVYTGRSVPDHPRSRPGGKRGLNKVFFIGTSTRLSRPARRALPPAAQKCVFRSRRCALIAGASGHPGTMPQDGLRPAPCTLVATPQIPFSPCAKASRAGPPPVPVGPGLHLSRR